MNDFDDPELEEAVYAMAVEKEWIDESVLRQYVGLYPQYEKELTEYYEEFRLEQAGQ